MDLSAGLLAWLAGHLPSCLAAAAFGYGIEILRHRDTWGSGQRSGVVACRVQQQMHQVISRQPGKGDGGGSFVWPGCQRAEGFRDVACPVLRPKSSAVIWADSGFGKNCIEQGIIAASFIEQGRCVLLERSTPTVDRSLCACSRSTGCRSSAFRQPDGQQRSWSGCWGRRSGNRLLPSVRTLRQL
jgi:hypothetical protein